MCGRGAGGLTLPRSMSSLRLCWYGRGGVKAPEDGAPASIGEPEDRELTSVEEPPELLPLPLSDRAGGWCGTGAGRGAAFVGGARASCAGRGSVRRRWAEGRCTKPGRTRASSAELRALAPCWCRRAGGRTGRSRRVYSASSPSSVYLLDVKT